MPINVFKKNTTSHINGVIEMNFDADVGSVSLSVNIYRDIFLLIA